MSAPKFASRGGAEVLRINSPAGAAGATGAKENAHTAGGGLGGGDSFDAAREPFGSFGRNGSYPSFPDSSDGSDTEGGGGSDAFEGLEGDDWYSDDEEPEQRLGLASLQQQLRRPLSHLWALPQQRVGAHGNHRWAPKISYYRTSSIGGGQQLLGEAEQLLRVRRPPEASKSLELGMVQQAMLRSVGPKWGRGVMPDQSDASDLDGLLHQPESALEKMEKASKSSRAPPRAIAPSAPPVAMIMPPKAGLRNLGRPEFREGAGLNERSAAIGEAPSRTRLAVS